MRINQMCIFFKTLTSQEAQQITGWDGEWTRGSTGIHAGNEGGVSMAKSQDTE